MKKLNLKKVIAFLVCFSITFCIPCLAFGATDVTSYDTKESKKYPIILVHGLMGWGSDEMFGVNYWGGFKDLRKDMMDKGYEVYTPTVGSVSSNWDRACELYAHIKGGTVDYGEAHAKKFGHDRYGRTYPGIYNGVEGKVIDDNHKVQLIGHSMGGQTSRLLVQLLEVGSEEERLATKGNISPLFTGGKQWVHSVTTIATPHDGSVVPYVPNSIQPLFQQFIAGLAAIGGRVDSDNPCLDFRLDQWGLRKLPGESEQHYLKKVMESNIWKDTKDSAMWDLLPEGAMELNKWVKTQSDVYYFSIACKDTHEDLITKHQVPNINMNPLFLQSSFFIGSFKQDKPGEIKIGEDWWANDGLVSVISAKCPHLGVDKVNMVEYDRSPERGVWNYLGLVDDVDHLEVVQMFRYAKTLEPRYEALLGMLSNLP